jgi:hypothetical protein
MKRLSMTRGKMWFPHDVDPADCDWEPLPGAPLPPVCATEPTTQPMISWPPETRPGALFGN